MLSEINNKPSFTGTFKIVNSELYSERQINHTLDRLRRQLTPIDSPSSAHYTSVGDPDLTQCTYQEKINKNGFEVARDIFYYETERPFTYNKTLPYEKVIISVPDQKDSIVKGFLDDLGFKYVNVDLDKEKHCKYLLINDKKNNIDNPGYFGYGMLCDFFSKITDKFKILTADASKKIGINSTENEKELRVPDYLLPDLEEHLKGKNHIYTISDTPKYLDYSA